MPRLPPNVDDTESMLPFRNLRYMQSRLEFKSVGVARDWELQYWYIKGAAKWERANRYVDDAADLTWALHKWFNTAIYCFSVEAQNSCGVVELGQRYRRRFVLPEVPQDHPTTTSRILQKLPTLRESLLFRA